MVGHSGCGVSVFLCFLTPMYHCLASSALSGMSLPRIHRYFTFQHLALTYPNLLPHLPVRRHLVLSHYCLATPLHSPLLCPSIYAHTTCLISFSPVLLPFSLPPTQPSSKLLLPCPSCFDIQLYPKMSSFHPSYSVLSL